jgi:hypothetical protein
MFTNHTQSHSTTRLRVSRTFTALAVLTVTLGWTGVPAGAAQQWQPEEPRMFRGDLGRGDRTLSSGEYYDEFTIQARGGEEITFDLRSRQFDTYLIVVGPDGAREENDDFDGDLDHSVVTIDEAERGRYRVMVTSYEEGETGRYELRVEMGGHRPGEDPRRGAETIRVGQSRDGRLEWSDGRIPSGEFRDLYEFRGRPGQHILVELVSEEFDPYLIVAAGYREPLENDDADGRYDYSRIELTLSSNGTARITVTSYEPGETGRYRLRVVDTTDDGPFVGRPVLQPPRR